MPESRRLEDPEAVLESVMEEIQLRPTLRQKVRHVIHTVLGGSAVLMVVFAGQSGLSISRWLVLICSILWLFSMLYIVWENPTTFRRRLPSNIVIDILLYGYIVGMFRVNVADSYILLPAIITIGIILADVVHTWLSRRRLLAVSLHHN